MASGYQTLAKRAYGALLLVPLAILGGCGADGMTPVFGYLAGPAGQSQVAEFAPGRVLALPLPADFGRTVEAAQMLSAKYDGQTFLFEGRISITPERLVLVGVDAMGRRAMTATWDGRSLSIESAPWLPASVRPGSMLADVVMLYWPEAAVRKALTPTGCKLLTTAKTREVRCGEDTVLTAKYDWPAGAKWNGTLQYSNLAWRYEIAAQSKEITP
jgi:hypothetical protein